MLSSTSDGAYSANREDRTPATAVPGAIWPAETKIARSAKSPTKARHEAAKRPAGVLVRGTTSRTSGTTSPRRTRKIQNGRANGPTRMAAVASDRPGTVSYTHLRAHETRHDLVCRLLL